VGFAYVGPAMKISAVLAFTIVDNTKIKRPDATRTQDIWSAVLRIARITTTGTSNIATIIQVVSSLVITRRVVPLKMKIRKSLDTVDGGDCNNDQLGLTRRRG